MKDDLIENLSDVDVDFDDVYSKNKRKYALKKGFRILLISLLIVVAFVVVFASQFKLKTVVVEGNAYTSDEDIIKYSNLKINSSILISLFTNVSDNLEKSEEITSAVVKYENLNTISITVIEEEIIFRTNDKLYLKNGYSVSSDSTYPTIHFDNFDEVSSKDNLIDEFAQLQEISPEVYEFISQVSYAPSEIVEDRILILMRDSNKVYVSVDELSNKMKEYFNIVDNIYTEYGIVHGEINMEKGREFIEFKPY